MGCCSSAQHGKAPQASTTRRVTYVMYKGERHNLDTPPKDLRAFRERMYELDPVLRWRAWHPQAQVDQPLDIHSAETYHEYVTKYGAQKFIIHIVMKKPAEVPEPLRKYQGAVAMLLDKERNVIGNAVLITHRHVIVSDRLINKQEDLPNFFVYFQLENDVVVRFRRYGTWVHPETLEVAIAELDLEDANAAPVKKLTPVAVESVDPPKRNEPMDFLYNPINAPSLHCMKDSRVVANEDRFYLTDKGPDKALGAAYFHKNCKFAGVLLESQPSKHKRVLVITELLRYWRQQPAHPEVKVVMEEMGVKELPPEPAVEFGEEVVLGPAVTGTRVHAEPAVDFGDDVVLSALPITKVHADEAGPVEAEDINFDVAPLSLPPQVTLYTSKAFAVRSKGQISELVFHGDDDYKLFNQKVNVDLQPGFTLTATPDGLVLAGGSGSASQRAYFWTQAGFTPLPELPARHSNHCGVYLNGVVYLVSGELTAATSALNVTTKTWSAVAPLSERRSLMGSCAGIGCLYIAGGQTQTGTSSEILQFDVRVNQWKTLTARLEVPTCCVGMSQVEPGQLLFFGGMVNRNACEDMYVKNVESGELGPQGKLPIRASFREFSPSLDRDFLQFDSENHLFKLDSAKQEVLLLSLPPVY